MSPTIRIPARGVRRKPCEMNGLERKYADHLDTRKAAGEIIAWWFEPVKFRLAKATFYTPDFMLLMSDGLLQFHDPKGHAEDDYRVKIKVVAETHWPFAFFQVTERPKREGGGWLVEQVGQTTEE